MLRTYERRTKARLSFSDEPHAPVNMADSMEEVNVGGKKRRKWHVFCAILCCSSYSKFSQILPITSLDPETVQLPAFSIISAVCQRSLALVQHT